MAGAVGLQKLRDVRDEGVVRVGVGEEGADAEQHLGDGEGGTPLVLEDVEADAAVRVDVAVVDAGGEVDLGRLEGVVGGEVDVEEEDAAGVGGVVGPHDGGLPVEHIVADRAGAAVGRRVLAEVDQFLIDPFEGHVVFIIIFCFVSATAWWRCVSCTLGFARGYLWARLERRIKYTQGVSVSAAKNDVPTHNSS